MQHVPGDIVALLCENYLNYADAYMLSLTCKSLRTLVPVPTSRLMSLLRGIDGTDESVDSLSDIMDRLAIQPARLLDEIVLRCSGPQLQEVLPYLRRYVTTTTCLAAAVSNNFSNDFSRCWYADKFVFI